MLDASVRLITPIRNIRFRKVLPLVQVSHMETSYLEERVAFDVETQTQRAGSGKCRDVR